MKDQINYLYKIALLQYQNKEWLKAISAYEKILELKSDEYSSYYGLGCVYYQLGNLNEALDFFKKTVLIKHDYIEGYTGMGSVYMLQERWAEAIDSYHLATKLNKNIASAFQDLGLCYLEIKSFPEAEKAFIQAIKIGGYDEKSHLSLAEIYLNQARHDKSLDVLNQALQLYPNSSNVQYRLGRTYWMLEQWEDVVCCFNRVSNPEIGCSQLNRYLGLALLKLKKYVEAIEAFEKAIKQGDQNLITYKSLGTCYLKVGRLDDCERLLSEIRNTFPNVETKRSSKMFNALKAIFHR